MLLDDDTRQQYRMLENGHYGGRNLCRKPAEITNLYQAEGDAIAGKLPIGALVSRTQG